VVWSPAEWERLWHRLTPRQQRVVYLHVLVGLTHTEAADQLGISRGSVLGTWGRALERIRDALPGVN
jgi:DNA-directed RNA polymerase specialized sigma24 family protein